MTGPLAMAMPVAAPPVSIRRILVPVDFTEAAPVLVRYAMEIVRGRGAVLRLLHVIEAPVAYSCPMPDALATLSPDVDILGAAEKRLAAIVKGIRGPRVERRVVLGRPATEILREAGAWEADIVVIATHGRTGLRRALLGSVAEEVVRKSSCPVLTVRHASVATPSP